MALDRPESDDRSTLLCRSTMSPLLQSWYFRVRGEQAANPYVLYAAGNLGSVAALLAYPL